MVEALGIVIDRHLTSKTAQNNMVNRCPLLSLYRITVKGVNYGKRKSQ